MYNSNLIETVQDIPEETYGYPKPDVHVWRTYEFITDAPRWLVNLFHRAGTTLPVKQLTMMLDTYQCNDMSLVVEVLNKCIRMIPIDQDAKLGTKYKVNIKVGIDDVKYLTTADFQGSADKIFNRNIYLMRLNMGTELSFDMELVEITPQTREVCAMFHQFSFFTEEMQRQINEINSASDFKHSIDKLNALQFDRHKLDVPPFKVKIMTSGNYKLPYIIANSRKLILETYNYIAAEFDKLELDHELLDRPGYFKYQISIPEDIAVYSGALISYLENKPDQADNITIITTYNRNNKNTTYKIIARAELAEVKQIINKFIDEIKAEVKLFDF